MQIANLDIIGQLERLAEACPWDTVSLWAHRAPEGAYSFTCHVEPQPKYGLPSLFGHGFTPEEAASDLLKQTAARTPELARERAIKELQEQIDKLRAVIIGPPPYRPGRILSNGEKVVQAQPTINV